MFYKGKGRPITEEDVRSFNQPGVITSPVAAYRVEGEIIIQTTCHQIGGSRGMLRRIPDFVLPEGMEPWLTIEPAEAMGETA